TAPTAAQQGRRQGRRAAGGGRDPAAGGTRRRAARGTAGRAPRDRRPQRRRDSAVALPRRRYSRRFRHVRGLPKPSRHGLLRTRYRKGAGDSGHADPRRVHHAEPRPEY
ncbi:MAG: hypothetical protein BJ554DRAFT_7680, partial [Olpidium bornovanus]